MAAPVKQGKTRCKRARREHETLSPEDGCKILQGDCAVLLREIPSASVQCCVTSPPYWGLRDYDVESQIGAENNVDDYLQRLVEVFRQVRRTLREDGTLWLNMGDSYTSGGRATRATDQKNPAREMSYRPQTPDGLKPKDLIGLPWKVAFALQKDGWYLRSDIIWYKPNCQPESVNDRPTKSHEYVFLFSKAEQYFYDSAAVREPTVDGNSSRNLRTLWTIPTEPYRGAHFAVFPPDLVRTCLLAGSSKGSLVLDPFLGSGTVGKVCISKGRRFIGMELNPKYVAMAKERVFGNHTALASPQASKIKL